MLPGYEFRDLLTSRREASEDYGSRRREDNVLAAVGGLSLVGILVVVLIVVAIVYFVRRV
jgi:hypothetical protein